MPIFILIHVLRNPVYTQYGKRENNYYDHVYILHGSSGKKKKEIDLELHLLRNSTRDILSHTKKFDCFEFILEIRYFISN